MNPRGMTQTLDTGARTVNSISGRLSLRAPQRHSLTILGRVTDILDITRELNPQEALEVIRKEFATVEDFERAFPSLCFALATGVGKTRLMGAFITYLYVEKGIKHFFVVAPNLTVYTKLITDFTPNTPKYVFQGIAEFATTPPKLITGDNYQQFTQRPLGYEEMKNAVEINIFNISKINSEMRGGKEPLIKRFREVIGTSYFSYLSDLKDLVVLMDESHHYRATAGVRAINELRPVLGLELTATPQVERGGKATPFKNVIYSYPLSSALKDGFVKEPTVITRENFNPSNYTPEQLERLKLGDAVRLHEDTKVELDLYARQHDTERVKPFILVIAQNTEHAGALLETIQSETFFEGRYKDRVITVHSSLTGEEREDNVQRLMQVENPKERTEIVIHVNMLKEGWDVTNLYTIVPLRAANSKTLIEQSIGRGLRLPFGRRTGVKPVDRLNIIAHDKFSEIIAEANKPDSIIRSRYVVDPIAGWIRRNVIPVASALDEAFAEPPTDEPAGEAVTGAAVVTTTSSRSARPPQPRIFDTVLERQMARRVRAAIGEQYSHLPTSEALLQPEVQEGLQRVAQQAAAAVQLTEGTAEGVAAQQPDAARVVATVTSMFMERTIDIPLIRFTPIGHTTGKYERFDLDLSNLALQPVSQDILIHYLRTHERERVHGTHTVRESRPENYLVNHLRAYDDVSYDEHADVLYDLAAQVVRHVRGYLADDGAVDNVLQFHGKRLAELVHTQMQVSYREEHTAYEVNVVQGFSQLRANSYDAPEGYVPADFWQTVSDPQRIRRMIFSGFTKCLYPLQKFDSNTELEFARLLERDGDVLKWFKPARTQLSIHYERGHYYEPDFVVEAQTHKYLCEPKRSDQVNDEIVLKKARAAAEWCRHASEHARANHAKPWTYLLIEHNAFDAATTLQTLADSCAVT